MGVFSWPGLLLILSFCLILEVDASAISSRVLTMFALLDVRSFIIRSMSDNEWTGRRNARRDFPIVDLDCLQYKSLGEDTTPLNSHGPGKLRPEFA